MHHVITVETQSGSEYYIEHKDGKWWLTANNVPNSDSVALDGRWRIHKPVPYPPIVGKRLRLFSYYYEEQDNPDRMPGGGKFTSRVVKVTTHYPPEEV